MPSRSALKMQQIFWPVWRSSCLLHPSMRCLLRMTQMIHRFSFEPCPSLLSVTSKVVGQNQLSVPNVGGFYCEDQRAVYHGDCPRVYQRVTLPKKHQTYHRATVHGRNTRKTNTRLPRCKPRCESNLKVLYADATAKLGAYYVCPDFGTCHEGGFKHTRCIDLLN